MRYNKTLFDFFRLTDNQMGEFTVKILDSMAANPVFAAIQPAIDEVANAFKVFNAKNLPKQNMTPTMIEARRKLREVLDMRMTHLNYSVCALADNDLEMLKSSGFTIAKPATKRPAPTAPTAVTIAGNGNYGQLLVSCPTVANADVYETEFWLLNKPATVYTGANRTPKITVENVPTTGMFVVIMRAKNANGTSEWSNEVTVPVVVTAPPAKVEAAKELEAVV